MKLSNNDVVYLRSLGYTDTRSLKQIRKAAGLTVYTMEERRISGKQAAEILERKAFLSGISRSAFHRSAVRKTEDGRMVFFDSSRLFKEEKTNER